MDSPAAAGRMRQHAAVAKLKMKVKRQGPRPGVPTTVQTTSIGVTDTAVQESPTEASTTSRSTRSTPSSSTSISTPPPDTSTSTTSTTISSDTEQEDTSTTTTSTEESTTESSTTLSTTTILSTSTSTSTPPRTSSTSTSALTTSTLSTPTSRSLVTSFVTASAAISSTLSASGRNTLSDSASSSTDSGGPSAGTVVGIVAGALVGVVVLSGIVGYFFRTKCSNKNDADDYDGENPFGTIDNAYGSGGQSRAELRRDSQLLADGADDASIHQMSELGHGSSSGYAMAGGAGAAAAGAYGLNRANTTMTNTPPGLQRADTVTPRPPTMIQRHYANMAAHQPQPQFQPGQIVQPGQYYSTNPSNQSGPYPSFPPGMMAAGAGAAGAGYGHSRGYSNEQQQYGDMPPQRSGTPEHQNVQQYFHQAHDSYSSTANATMGAGTMPGNGGGAAGINPFESQGATARQQAGGGMDSQTRARRTLSVRNGGLDDPSEGGAVRDSVYGGM